MARLPESVHTCSMRTATDSSDRRSIRLALEVAVSPATADVWGLLTEPDLSTSEGSGGVWPSHLSVCRRILVR